MLVHARHFKCIISSIFVSNLKIEAYEALRKWGLKDQEFKDSLYYMRTCFKKQKQDKIMNNKQIYE